MPQVHHYRLFRLCIIGLLPAAVMAGTAQAEIWRWTGDNGEVEYSDEYRAGAERVELPEISTISLPSGESAAANEYSAGNTGSSDADPQDTESATQSYGTLEITFPEHDSAFYSGSGDISITTRVDPPLASGHQLQLLLDSEPAGNTTGSSFSLANMDRGTHILQLQVVDRTDIVQSSAPVTFTLHRPSLLNR